MNNHHVPFLLKSLLMLHITYHISTVTPFEVVEMQPYWGHTAILLYRRVLYPSYKSLTAKSVGFQSLGWGWWCVFLFVHLPNAPGPPHHAAGMAVACTTGASGGRLGRSQFAIGKSLLKNREPTKFGTFSRPNC